MYGLPLGSLKNATEEIRDWAEDVIGYDEVLVWLDWYYRQAMTVSIYGTDIVVDHDSKIEHILETTGIDLHKALAVPIKAMVEDIIGQLTSAVNDSIEALRNREEIRVALSTPHAYEHDNDHLYNDVAVVVCWEGEE